MTLNALFGWSVGHMMYSFYRENSTLLVLYQGFSEDSNFLSSQLDQTWLSAPILDRDPHQSNNTGSHRLVICRYLVGTWKSKISRIKNIFSHRIWWHSKILFVPPPFRFLETKWKHLSDRSHSSYSYSLLNEHFYGWDMGDTTIYVILEKHNDTKMVWIKEYFQAANEEHGSQFSKMDCIRLQEN